MKQPTIAIVGGGPAGLIAALTAQRLGFCVAVYEQAAAFHAVGGGLLLHSNGQRVLNALGLLDTLRPQLCLTDQLRIEKPDGRPLSIADYSTLDIPFNRSAIVLRHTLQDHMLAAVREAGIAVHFGRRCTDATVKGDTVVLHCATGEQIEADIVIGCDGVNSRIREAAGIPFKKSAIGEGWLRGVITLPGIKGPIREIWGDDGRRFGICPLPGDRVYFFCRAPYGQWAETRDHGLERWIESWRPFGSEALAVLKAVTDWNAINYSELYEIRMPRWSRPPIFLIGDAAHAMTPNLGQGANSAMVDALVLVRMLAAGRDGGETLEQTGRRFDALRRPFVSTIQKASRQAGAIAALKLGRAAAARDAVMRLAGAIRPLRRRMQLLTAGYNPKEELFFHL